MPYLIPGVYIFYFEPPPPHTGWGAQEIILFEKGKGQKGRGVEVKKNYEENGVGTRNSISL